MAISLGNISNGNFLVIASGLSCLHIIFSKVNILWEGHYVKVDIVKLSKSYFKLCTLGGFLFIQSNYSLKWYKSQPDQHYDYDVSKSLHVLSFILVVNFDTSEGKYLPYFQNGYFFKIHKKW